MGQHVRGKRHFRLRGRLLLRRLCDPLSRQRLQLTASLAFHTTYTLFQLIAGLVARTRWVLSLAVYTALLTLVRFFLLRDLTRVGEEQTLMAAWRRYRFCGIMLLAMTPALIVLVTFTVKSTGHGMMARRGQGLITVMIALYTVGTFTAAAGSIKRAHRQHGPLLSAAKAVSLVTASVSLFSLVVSLLQSVGDAASAPFRGAVAALLGTALSLLIFSHALGMIFRAGRALRRQAEAPTQHR